MVQSFGGPHEGFHESEIEREKPTVWSSAWLARSAWDCLRSTIPAHLRHIYTCDRAVSLMRFLCAWVDVIMHLLLSVSGINVEQNCGAGLL